MRLRANKVRAGLTILGIAVGVFVVVAMEAAINGINTSVAKDIESAGATTFFVQRYPLVFTDCDGSDEKCPWRHNPPLRLAEGQRLGAVALARWRHHGDRLVSGLQVRRPPAPRRPSSGGTRPSGRAPTAATLIPAAPSRPRKTRAAPRSR